MTGPDNSVTKTIRMPRSILDKWLTALRSGEYKQGKSALYNPMTKGYCCLGVLEACLNKGQVSDNEGILQTVDNIDSNFEYIAEEYDPGFSEDAIERVVSSYPSQSRLDPRIRWVGKTESYSDSQELTFWNSPNTTGLPFNPVVFAKPSGILTSDDEPLWLPLAELNDRNDYTFEQIADLVETHTEVIDE